MESRNCVLGSPKSKENYQISGHVPHGHMKKHFGYPGSVEVSEKFDEFSEEDVWGVVEIEANHADFQENGARSVAVSRLGSKEANNNAARRMKIPRSGNNHHDENGSARMRYQSAPVNIPDWSQILKSENCRRMKEAGDDDGSGDDDGGDKYYEERIPPHELIAKQLARSQMTSFSVYEGAGRTLKGRDLSRVRNAVWSRTGFLE